MRTVDRRVTEPMGRHELQGRATAVFLLSFFAFVWVGWGTSVLDPAVAIPASCATLALCACTVIGGLRRYRRARRLPAEQPDSAVLRRFGRVVAAEWVAVIVAAAVLGNTGNAQWIPAVVCLGVGVHFFPLARMFRIGMYDVTGTVLVLLALVTMTVVPVADLPPALWNVVPGVGAAIALWGTTVCLLRTTRAAEPD